MPHTYCKSPGSNLYTGIFLGETGYGMYDAVSRIMWNCEGLEPSQPNRQSYQKLVGHVAVQVKGMWRRGGKLFNTQDPSLRSSAFKQCY